MQSVASLWPFCGWVGWVMSLRYICDIGLDCLGSGGDVIDGPMGIRGSIVGLCSMMDVVQMDYAMWSDICL
jgi:hypothetical protein